MPDLSIEKLLLFLFAVVPGFIAIQVYSLKCPPAKREWGNSLIEVTTYSLINLTIWWWWVARIVTTPFAQIDPLTLTAAMVIVCLLSPVLLALGWYWLRTRLLHHKLGMDHPTPRGWDHFVKNNHHFCALFHLKNGKMVGGYFGARSYAATFPQEPEIYVEQVWRVNEDGEFVEMVPGTMGAVIRLSECERVEFLEAVLETEHGQTGTDEGGATGQVGPSEGGTGRAARADGAAPTEAPAPSAAGGIGNGEASQSGRQVTESGEPNEQGQTYQPGDERGGQHPRHHLGAASGSDRECPRGQADPAEGRIRHGRSEEPEVRNHEP
jgi:hypothetical protein